MKAFRSSWKHRECRSHPFFFSAGIQSRDQTFCKMYLHHCVATSLSTYVDTHCIAYISPLTDWLTDWLTTSYISRNISELFTPFCVCIFMYVYSSCAEAEVKEKGNKRKHTLSFDGSLGVLRKGLKVRTRRTEIRISYAWAHVFHCKHNIFRPSLPRGDHINAMARFLFMRKHVNQFIS